MVGFVQHSLVTLQLKPDVLASLQVHVNGNVDVVAVVALASRRERTADDHQVLLSQLHEHLSFVVQKDLVKKDAEVISTANWSREVGVLESTPLIGCNLIEHDWLVDFVHGVRLQRYECNASV